jgi:hypothetical protein
MIEILFHCIDVLKKLLNQFIHFCANVKNLRSELVSVFVRKQTAHTLDTLLESVHGFFKAIVVSVMNAFTEDFLNLVVKESERLFGHLIILWIRGLAFELGNKADHDFVE